jgi:hypothetical protein
MKKCVLLIILSTLTFICKAPEWKSLSIIKVKPIERYESLIKAITWVESKNGLFVWNPLEEAVGWFAIRPIRVKDYNKRTGNHYQLKDFYDYNLSKKMFLYYANGKSLEQAAKNWNGSGPMTIDYWNEVKKYLN